jgi:hypothetical protein
MVRKWAKGTVKCEKGMGVYGKCVVWEYVRAVWECVKSGDDGVLL